MNVVGIKLSFDEKRMFVDAVEAKLAPEFLADEPNKFMPPMEFTDEQIAENQKAAELLRDFLATPLPPRTEPPTPAEIANAKPSREAFFEIDGLYIGLFGSELHRDVNDRSTIEHLGELAIERYWHAEITDVESSNNVFRRQTFMMHEYVHADGESELDEDYLNEYFGKDEAGHEDSLSVKMSEDEAAVLNEKTKNMSGTEKFRFLLGMQTQEVAALAELGIDQPAFNTANLIRVVALLNKLTADHLRQ